MKEKFIANNYWSRWWQPILHLLDRIYLKIKDFVWSIKRRNKNKHNVTILKHAIDMEKVKVWNYTLWPLDIRLSPAKSSYVEIWSYCCIAAEVEFLWLSNHPTNWLTTEWIAAYMTPNWIAKINNPYWKWCNLTQEDRKIIQKSIEIKQEETCHWPIIVDDDVRIWTWAKIMSWVHIWQWAVIAAWAVVTKNIPPYAIAGWVPAKVIKYRFSEDKIKKLLQIDYFNLPIEKLWEIYPETIKEDFDIDYILKKLKE